MPSQCPLCHVRKPNKLAWFSAPGCPPRGLRQICERCTDAAAQADVPEYEFHSADIAEAVTVLQRCEWDPLSRSILLNLLN